MQRCPNLPAPLAWLKIHHGVVLITKVLILPLLLCALYTGPIFITARQAKSTAVRSGLQISQLAPSTRLPLAMRQRQACIKGMKAQQSEQQSPPSALADSYKLYVLQTFLFSHFFGCEALVEVS